MKHEKVQQALLSIDGTFYSSKVTESLILTPNPDHPRILGLHPCEMQEPDQRLVRVRIEINDSRSTEFVNVRFLI